MSDRLPDYQPALRWWSHLWRFVLVVGISALAWVGYAEAEWSDAPALFWIDLGLGIAGLVLMQFRRRWPYSMALLTSIMLAFSATAAGPSCLVTVSLATQRRWGQIVSIGIIGFACSTVYTLVAPPPTGNQDPGWLTLATDAVFTVALMAIGMYVGSRRELLWTLRERASRAEEEQELRVSQARTNERSRIAREMHDVLAHRISLLTMHAGALAYRTDLDRDEIARSASIIQSSAHEALSELRSVLGVLRDDGEAQAGRPQPTLCDVPTLIEDTRASGTIVDYDDTLSEQLHVADQVGRTVYRIVQEGLTNARKHAPYARVDVTLREQDSGIRVEIRNPLRVGTSAPTPGAGLGLVGLAERAELSGGRLRHAVNARNEFELTAWLPCAP